MGEYLERVEEAQPVLNMGFMVGHTAAETRGDGSGLGRWDRVGRPDHRHGCAPADVDHGGRARLRVIAERNHFDGNGDPVPSAASSVEELVALATVAGELPGTALEFIPGHADILTRMSLAAGRPINWNVFLPNAATATEKLAWSDEGARRGARILALTYPGLAKTLVNFRYSAPFALLPGWDKFMVMPVEEKIARLSNPEERARMGALAEQARGGPLDRFSRWEDLVVVDPRSPHSMRIEDRRIGDVAAESGMEAWDLVCDIAIADRLMTSFRPQPGDDTPEDWEARIATWNDPRVVLGGSDAGAHLTTLATWDGPLSFCHSTAPIRRCPWSKRYAG